MKNRQFNVRQARPPPDESSLAKSKVDQAISSILLSLSCPDDSVN